MKKSVGLTCFFLFSRELHCRQVGHEDNQHADSSIDIIKQLEDILPESLMNDGDLKGVLETYEKSESSSSSSSSKHDDADADAEDQLPEGLVLGMAQKSVSPTSFRTNMDGLPTEVRIGNIRTVEGSNANLARKELDRYVDMHMVFVKSTPVENSTNNAGEMVMVGNVWTVDGTHVPSALVEAGTHEFVEEYEGMETQDILGKAAARRRKQTMSDLASALKEE